MKYDLKNNKYFRWGGTAFLTIAASICFYYLLFHGNSIKTGFHTITSKNLRTMKILYRGRRRFELTKIRLDDEKFFLPVFDEHRSCYKICWSDFVTLTEGVQVTKMQIKEDVV